MASSFSYIYHDSENHLKDARKTKMVLNDSTSVLLMLVATVFFRLLAGSKIGMQNCKISHDLNPPIESKLSCDILGYIGGFKSHDIL